MKLFANFLVISLGVLAVVASPVEKIEKRLIKRAENDPGVWLTESEIIALKENKESFIDITDHPHYPVKNAKPLSTNAIPTTLKFQDTVKNLLARIDRARVEAFVKEFSTFHTRYYQSETGEQSQKWLLSEVQTSLRNYSGVSSVKEVDHGFRQHSVVARIEGSDPTLKSEVVVLGAHQDSLNLRGSTLRAPGADDNASGSVTVLETLRVIAGSGVVPKRSIEFHWYAAEEVGLVGSGAIAQEYSRNGVNVVAMVNFDVDGYQAPGINDIGIYTDNVNSELTQFLRVLVDGYLDYGRRDTRCGYGCSDHASFHNYGFPAAFPAEVTFHPQMHSEQDSFENVGFTQVIEFVKLAVGFAVEIA
jgi:leucyl aminopeptidase